MSLLKPFSDEVLAYIESHANDDIYHLLLSKSPFPEIDMDTIVKQIIGRKIAAKKFPFSLKYPEYRYPAKLSLEQASSQITAEYKSYLIEGSTFADLTGGMGIDSYLIGKKFDSCTYVEPYKETFETSIHNFKLLDFKVQSLNTTCEEYLNSYPTKVDWIYLDPSRRENGNRRISIHNYKPNIVTLRDQLLEAGNNIMIKLSPMQDITECISVLGNIHNIWIISLNNEVKELLLHLKPSDCNDPIIHAIHLHKNHTTPLEVKNNYSKINTENKIGEISEYLYQPSAALIKSGLHGINANNFQLTKLHQFTHLYTSDKYIENYVGRIFKVKANISANKKEIKNHLPENKANILTKNFPLSPAQLMDKLKIKDGGDQYVIAYTSHDEKKKVCVCERLN